MNFDISQGSVATLVRCCEIFNVDFIANFIASLSVKELAYENRLAFGEVTCRSKGIRFLDHPVDTLSVVWTCISHAGSRPNEVIVQTHYWPIHDLRPLALAARHELHGA